MKPATARVQRRFGREGAPGAIDGWDVPIPDGLPVFLLGFSQGAHASLAALRAAETEPGATLVPDAVAAISGPYDLAGVQLPHSLGPDATGGVFYLAYLLDAYRRIYGGPAPAEVFAAPSTARCRGSTMASTTPRRSRACCRRAPTRCSCPGPRARPGSATRWRTTRSSPGPRGPRSSSTSPPATPTSPGATPRPRAYWAARGADVPVIQLGEVDHSTSAALGIVAARQWFDTLVE